MSFLTSFRVPKVDEIQLAVGGALQYEWYEWSPGPTFNELLESKSKRSRV